MPTKQPNLYGLTLKQSLFVSEYMKDQNGLQAAIRAGYTPKSAHAQACRLLKDAKVQAAIADRAEAAQVRSQVTVDRVLLEMARLAFADLTEVVQVKDGKVLIADTDTLSKDVRCAIAEISQSTGKTNTLKVRMHSKEKALEMLGRHLVMFKDKLDLDVGEGLVQLLSELRQRREAAGRGERDG